MTDTTPNLALPELIAAQAQKHVTVNEALRALDVLVQLAVLDRDLAAPPGSPAEGQRWLVAGSPTGAWGGHADEIAAWQDGDWEFYAPQPGWLVYVVDESSLLAWTGSAWVDAITILSLNNLTLLGIGTTADATNPFSAKLNNVLWVAKALSDGGDGTLRWKMSKESPADTLSMLFQTSFSGRAELGLTGDDDFHVKVSNDGSSWTEALTVDRATGGVRFLANSTDVASGATCNIGAAPSLAARITGTTTITSFGSVANALRFIRFAGALTLTHNATSLVLPGGATITTAAGDTAIATSDASGNWRLWHYQRADGFPLAPVLPSSTVDNQVLRADGTAGHVQGSSVTIGDDGKITAPAGVLSYTVTLADGAFTTIPLPAGTVSMIVMFISAQSNTTRPNGSILARCASSPACIKLGFDPAATSVDVTTGALTGTTGAAGHLTISAHSDGNLYVENRTGSSRGFGVSILSST
jgi:hypothetical protein